MNDTTSTAIRGVPGIRQGVVNKKGGAALSTLFHWTLENPDELEAGP
jgi:hypothetical protein